MERVNKSFAFLDVAGYANWETHGFPNPSSTENSRFPTLSHSLCTKNKFFCAGSENLLRLFSSPLLRKSLGTDSRPVVLDWYPLRRSILAIKKLRFFVRVARIELASQPWEGRILPLNHTRVILLFKVTKPYRVI